MNSKNLFAKPAFDKIDYFFFVSIQKQTLNFYQIFISVFTIRDIIFKIICTIYRY